MHFRRWWLSRTARSCRCRQNRHMEDRDHQTIRHRQGICLIAQTVGGRENLCLDQPVSAPLPRFRTLRQNRRRLRSPRHDPYHAPALDQTKSLSLNPYFLDRLSRKICPKNQTAFGYQDEALGVHPQEDIFRPGREPARPAREAAGRLAALPVIMECSPERRQAGVNLADIPCCSRSPACVFSRALEAALAQPVEHRIRNAGVGCSSHPGGTSQSVLLHSFRPRARIPPKVPPNGASVRVRVGSKCS